MKIIDMMPDGSEIIHYDKPGIPLYIQSGLLSSYPNKRALCHWHEDIEIICILQGSMNYYVNGKKILLKENDSVFINTKQMHYGYSNQNQDCLFVCILFHPSLITKNSALYQSYIRPVTDCRQLEYIHVQASDQHADEILFYINQIAECKGQTTSGYELTACGYLSLLWKYIFGYYDQYSGPKQETDPNLLSQRAMVAFIHQHYSEKLSLSDIAASGNVCRNKCCHLFREYAGQPPIDFLNIYRLKVSCDLLVRTNNSITDIALSCGFNHLSYYSKLFLQKYGCTPSEYRRANLSDQS